MKPVGWVAEPEAEGSGHEAEGRGVHRVEFRFFLILRIGLFGFESFIGKFETRLEFERIHVKPTQIRIFEFESNSVRIRVYPNSVEKNILLQI